MSTISRICLRCRIQLFSNIQALPSAVFQRCQSTSQHSFISTQFRSQDQRSIRPQSKTYTTKPPDTPDSPGISIRHVHKTKSEIDTFSDPVRVKLEGKVEVDMRRVQPALTTTDVEEFLAKASKPTLDTHNMALEDAHRIDQSYEQILSGFWRTPISLDKLPPALKNLASKFNYPPATHLVEEITAWLDGKEVVIHGFIKHVRIMNKNLAFLDLYDFRSGPGYVIQLVSSIEADSPKEARAMHDSFAKLPPFMPVAVKGTVNKTSSSPPLPEGLSGYEQKQWTSAARNHKPDIRLTSLHQLNSVSPDLIYTPNTVYPPEKRHLQLRTSTRLSSALRMRSVVSSMCREILKRNGFTEVETPLLFKSTPEGAREFLVPTRNKENGGGMCYALPQSPQQYKQILMASGVSRYFQFARCFRDEDLRADRQPEFTQLDIEMSFARQEDVIQIVQTIVSSLWRKLLGHDISHDFKRISYTESMKSYGIDKPDLRFGHYKIHRVHYRQKEYQSAETFYIRRRDSSESALKNMKMLHDKFVAKFQGIGDDRFMSYMAGEDTANGVPEHNLLASNVEDINERLDLQQGDLVILKKRHGAYKGGSTGLGRLRVALLDMAVAEGIIDKPAGYSFVWVTDFPLFSPVSKTEPGQSSTAGLASTHHPFTAPHENDFELLATEPIKVRAEHYDLVVNGVELGGGSRRIHDPELQRYILEDIMKVHPSKIHQFDHLIDVLGSGCPPHAGIALGFDRLIAIMTGAESLRDVIPFPKNSKGADPMVGSPSLVSEADLQPYGLKRE